MSSNSITRAMVIVLACTSACADDLVSQPQHLSTEPDVVNAALNVAESSPIENNFAYASEIGIHASPVVGGKESALCGWPSTVDVAGCTATLIHPRVVATAAHCLGRDTSARVTFTAGRGQQGSFMIMGDCTVGARGGRGGVGSRDWAYCVLPEDERVKKIPFTPPLGGCEAERYLKPGNTAWVVGFGATGGNANDYGVKREVEVKINRVQDGIIDVGDRDAGACYGDSGGPLYIKITDGTHDWGWRVAGSTSGAGGPCDCTCSTIYTDVERHIAAIEENEGIDVTPCTDADGNWDPGPDCKELITNPGMATGTYPDCTVERTTVPIASCGEPAANTGAAGGAAGAAGGAAGVSGSPAAGSGSAAGSGAAAAAGSGGDPLGAAGMSAMSGGAEATAGRGGNLGADGASGAPTASPSAGGAAATGGAGTTGMQANAFTMAGGPSARPGPAPSAEHASGGCQASPTGEQHTGTAALFGSLLLAIWARSARRRQRDAL